MSTKTRPSVLSFSMLAILCVVAAPASAGWITRLEAPMFMVDLDPPPPPPEPAEIPAWQGQALAISANGNRVVGFVSETSTDIFDPVPAYWDVTNKTTGAASPHANLTITGNQGYASAISADGQVIAGIRGSSLNDLTVPVRWDSAGGNEIAFPTPTPSGAILARASATAVLRSGGVNTVLGDRFFVDPTAPDPADEMVQKNYQWTNSPSESEIVIPGFSDGLGNALPKAATDSGPNGVRIVGMRRTTSDFHHEGAHAVYIDPAVGTMQTLPYLNPGSDVTAGAMGVSPDGNTIVGFSGNPASSTFGPYPIVSWTKTVSGWDVNFLGNIPGGGDGGDTDPGLFTPRDPAMSMSVANNGTVVGTFLSILYSPQAFVWDSTNGIQFLRDALLADGVSEANDWDRLDHATGISADGSVITGIGTYIDTVTTPGHTYQYEFGFIAQLGSFTSGSGLIPEPNSLAIWTLGLLGLALFRRRRP